MFRYVCVSGWINPFENHPSLPEKDTVSIYKQYYVCILFDCEKLLTDSLRCKNTIIIGTMVSDRAQVGKSQP